MSELGKRFRKKSDQKKIEKKTVKIKVKFPHVNKKTTSENAYFCSNTVFSLYFKIRAKKVHAAKPLAFSLHFLFRRDQNQYPNLTSKFMKMCEQIFKKRQRPNTIQILCKNCKKNQEHRNKAPLSSQLRSYEILQLIIPLNELLIGMNFFVKDYL